MISSWSVTDSISLLVINSKLVCASMIFVDNKLALISLLMLQQLAAVSVRYTQVFFTFLASSASLRINVKGKWGT